MQLSVSHDRRDESPEAKARWFKSLSVSERMEIFCSFTDLALSLNPALMEKKVLSRLQEVFASFESHDVRYVVIGGIAAILHGVPRATFDLDILIEATPENARRLLEALTDAQMGTAAMTSPEEIMENAITVFQDRVRLDVQTTTPGVTFEKVWARRKTMNYKGQVFYVLSKADLIASKLAAGRDVDLEDARLLKLDEDNEKKGT